MVTKAKPTNQRYETLTEALNIIDPQGNLIPGTLPHNSMTETILLWMDELDSDEVIRRSAIMRRMFIKLQRRSVL
jgi:hypothetical protein